MDESEANLSSDSSKMTPSSEKPKPKKRSLVERELETSLTARVTSPAISGEGTNTSRYGRARRAKTDTDFCNIEKTVSIALKSPRLDKTPIKSPTAYKMHASNSPVGVESVLQNQIENIYNANVSLSRFSSEEKAGQSPSPAVKKFPNTYVKTDLIQTKEKEETITLIKNMFSPNKSSFKPIRNLSNLERSSEKCVLNGPMLKQHNGYAEKASIVKALDFDSKQKSKSTEVSVVKSLSFDGKSRRKDRELAVLSKSELFDLEAKCEYQVGDLAWARMGTYPFWPCIVTREPESNMFVRNKLFGRIERNIINVTFFGDNGRRSWVVDTMLRKFQGLKEFEATREQFKPEDKKRDPRLYAAFFISDKKQALWLKSVQEAETFMKEPKRLRIDLFYDLLEKSKTRQNQKSQKKVSRADSDVSLSESLLDTLFCEDDAKSDDPDRTRKKRMSLDVSEVVTACLDNMAARTGLTQIQKQSHMDRWLQKAKSKTPEKSQLEITVTVEKVDDVMNEGSNENKKKAKTNEKRISKDEDKIKKKVMINTVSQKPYSLRKSTSDSHLLPIHNEHDYSAKFNVDNCYVKLENIPLNDKVIMKLASVNNNTCDKIGDNENDLHCLTNGVVDHQIGIKILNESVNEKVLVSKKFVTDTANVSSLETNVESSYNDKKITIDITGDKIVKENEKNSLTNEVVREINKSVTQEEKIPKNDIISNQNKSSWEMDVDIGLDENESYKEVDNDNSDKVFSSKTVSACHIEVQNDNNSKKKIADDNINDEANDIPLFKKNEKTYEKQPTETHASNDLTINEENHEISCSDDSTDVRTEILLGNNELVSNLLILESEKEIVKSKKNTNEKNSENVSKSIQAENFTIKTSSFNNVPVSNLLIQVAEKEQKTVESKENKDKKNSKYDRKSIQAETLNIDENMTMKHTNGKNTKKDSKSIGIKGSIKTLSPVKLPNNMKYSTGELDDKLDNVTGKDFICDAHITMLPEEGCTEIHENKSDDKTEMILQDMTESLADNNKREILIIKDNLECKIKRNDVRSKINKNSESDIQTSLVLNSIKNNLDSEIKNNFVEYKIKSKDLESVINKCDTKYQKMNENSKNELISKDLKCDKNYSTDSEKQNIKFCTKAQSSASLESCSVVVVPLNGPTLNGYYENTPKDLKEERNTDSDTASTNSELDDVSLIELKKRTIAKTRARQSLTLKKQNSTENVVGMREIHSQSPLPKIVQMSSGEVKINGNTEADVDKDETAVTKRVLRPRIDTPVESLNPSKESSPERKLKEEIDSETASITSEGSNISAKRRGRPKDKASDEDKMKDPEFIRYLELRQDTLIDEHPELSLDEIMAYLYKTWLYEQSCKSDFVKSHDKEQSNLVKGINPDAPQLKTKKRPKQDKNKLINIDKVFKKELIEEFSSISSKDKPKRKTSQPCYVEDYSDIEDEIKMFEIFKDQKEKTNTPELIQQNNVASSSSEIKEETKEELSPEEYYDEVEAYFEELTKPKPNIFRGLVREKVCEICEKTSNLVKCKGCNGMFHIECVKKETDIVDVPVSTRVRRKKKKPRGRRPKSSIDSNGLDESYSDEKSQDASVSEENKSMEQILDESHIVVADVDNFEAQVAAKMKEIMEIDDKIDYDSYLSDDCLDWRHTIAGKCEIVDVKLKPKTPEIDNSNFKCKNCQKDDVPLCFVCKSPVSPKSQINHRQKCQVAHCHKFYHLECLEYWPQTQLNTVDPSKNKGNVDVPSETVTCPRHVCHTCVCDDPRGCKTRFSGDKLARCVRCPATYHSFTKCLPAGSQILTASHIICPRHYEHRPGKVPCHVNTGWCFICAQGGTLICCEYCPTSFHAECLQIDPPDGGYMCEDCETGRLPLYGEMVWVKLGHYRWWPGIVLHPHQIPSNIMAVRHSPGEFVVRFFGQYDHYWVNRGRVFPYQEGDSGRISSQKSKIDEAFTKAMEHAQRAFEILKTLEENEEESPDIASSLLPPHYVKLKSNKPFGGVSIKRELEESSLTQCECDPNEEQPCGPTAHCLNRMLLTECGPSCRAGDRCNNRAFERREYPRLTAYRTKHRGWGLKALEDIKAGQFVIEYVGELIDEEEFRRRMRRKHEIRDENFYFLTLDKERMIDAGPKGNLARFMNHCCEPNCETQKWTVLGDIRVGLFALKDIPANSELTFNYNLECAGIEKKRCMCGAKRCSGYIGAKPKQEEKEPPKKPKVATKRPYKKRKPEDCASDKNKPKRPVGRPPKPRELTEIEKDLLIIKNATNGISSDSECSGRLSSVDAESERKDMKALKRKRVSFSSEDVDSNSKRVKYDEDKTSSEVD